ncbi:MAG: ABC transporter substrate-binding protein [Candidatus Devosia symbiotica]|nr:ABC transporter substrate-binding protein [Candidatus Devosia symbiotica]
MTTPGEVTLTSDQTGNRELPLILSQLRMLPQHWWEGKDASGKLRDIAQSTLEAPMGSGPYKLASFDPSRTITYQRDPSYWGVNQPTRVGTNNFDQYKIEYFLDLSEQFEAFKGNQMACPSPRMVYLRAKNSTSSIRSRISCPPRSLTEPYTNPIGGDSTKLRENLRQALTLFNLADYTLDGTKLVDASGNPFTFEILVNGPTIEPIAANLVANLALIGVDVTVRSVDNPQYINRIRSQDYDVIYAGRSQSLFPGNEPRYFFGSASVDDESSQNYAGIADPGVDALINKVIGAKD